ncbi:MAG: NAD(P)/FAD-dependent oxidoreductase [Chloroflexi bacterium]|nr:NAD(P)/FAD-dependent oxidoreductase [Chloroflexota bacterium]
MEGKTILILGGGWGGLTAAHHLRGLLPSEHRVLVVERKDSYFLCPNLLWVMTGERRFPEDVSRPMSKLSRQGIEWIHEEVQRIEPETRTIHTNARALQGDYLIIALGTEQSPNSVPGFAESAHNLYTGRGAVELQRFLSEFQKGRVAILIARTPFRCPAAPYEAAFLADWLLRKRGVRGEVEISLFTPEKQPMPVAGRAVGEALRVMLTERQIQYYPERTVSKIDGASHRLFFGSEEASYDLLIGVPPHKASRLIEEAGLTDSTDYVPVHPQNLKILSDPSTLETRFPGVFAIGDVTSIRLPNMMLLPKAGVFAEAEAAVVARIIASEITGVPASGFDGRGFCYVDVGDGMAAFGSGNFYAYPSPSMTLEAPSPRYRRDKEEFERVLESWFTR